LKSLEGNGDRSRALGKGIGLKNVRARLRIFFDAQEEFKIYSKKGRGTLVWISFPIVEKPA